MTDPRCVLSVIFCGFILNLIVRETINIPEIFSGVHGFYGKDWKFFIISQVLVFIHWMVFDFIFYYVTVNTLYSVFIQVRVVLKRTVVGDLHFNNVDKSHFQSQVNSVNHFMVLQV